MPDFGSFGWKKYYYGEGFLSFQLKQQEHQFLWRLCPVKGETKNNAYQIVAKDLKYSFTLH
ncbi:hypothetical protein XBI1_2290007 [Xenorhabdus bovienii str. Intermedium]|uniref:Uncharacterized protein n=1 Tax=Xenorhabdus bovienii str. Intermedium TaxID=1379677 RepID=A0A077QI91_XENBV|nr:hypothetical protein XBI1_2290007 [Xenorhabdus bovienii str. Intermedium]